MQDSPQCELAPTTTRRGDDASTPRVNQAGSSNSPFLQDRAQDAVHWQLLDDKAVEAARRENKLIFLHVGYRACHFCYLMAIESFSYPECASILNSSFIPVVVDREERPDIDTIYMNYFQAVNSSGGWPLNIFLTPDLEPVFGGTYWRGPGAAAVTGASGAVLEDRLDEVGPDFIMILTKVQRIWNEQEVRCRKEAEEVVCQLREFAAEGTLGAQDITTKDHALPSVPGAHGNQTDRPTPRPHVSIQLDLDQLEEAFKYFAGTFDPIHAGFGLPPKFLTPPKLSFLLRLGLFPSAVQDVVGEAECAHARDLVLKTLRAIRDGGLRDHVGGSGLSRCSVTADWSMPNFEKLVVDNAMMLRLYVSAWTSSGGKKSSEFLDMVVELVDYLISPPIRLPEGGFASSETAYSCYRRGDPDMGEGAYYVWTKREFFAAIQDHTDAISPAPLAARYWNVLEDGNVERDHDPNDEFVNQNILRVGRSLADVSRSFGISTDQAEALITTARRRLKARRDRDRARPEIDDKMVAGWNGLVASALARTSAAIRIVDPDRSDRCLSTAKEALMAVKDRLWDGKQLYRMYRGGLSETKAFADDYSYLVEGALDLYGASKDADLLSWAQQLQDTQITLFYDAAPDGGHSGAFFSTVENASCTILRLKDGIDGSLPSTNAVAVSNLFRLGARAPKPAESPYTHFAHETVAAFEPEMLQYPGLFPGLLAGVVWSKLGFDDNNTGI